MSDLTVTIGNEVKALGDGKIGGHLVIFSDDSSPDLTGDWFASDTDYDLDDGEGKSATLYHHGLDPIIGKRNLARATLRQDDVGVWMEAQLTMRDEYEKALYSLVEAGKMGLSSGTAAHLVDREEQENGTYKITRWPLGLDASITPIPAEPRTSVVPLKTYLEMTAHVKALLPQDDAPKASSEQRDEAQPEPEPTTELSQESDTMTEEIKEQPAPTLDVDDLVARVADAVYQKLEAEPPVKTAGVQVEKKPAEVKEAPELFTSFGDQLKAVAMANTPGGYIDRRLYNVQAMKAPTGLGETVPSDGGYLVQPTFAQELWRRAYDTGILASRTRRIPLGPNSNRLALNAVSETSRATGSRWGGIRGYWAAEAEEKTASTPAFRRINLELKKLVGLCYATDELLADTSALESVIGQGFAEEFGFLIDDAIINGTGAGVPLGIMNSGSLVSVAAETGQAAATIVTENIVKMWSRLWGRSLPNAVWFINQDIQPQLFTMALSVGTGGAPTYLPPGGLSQAPYGTLMGRPVVPIEQAATLGTVGDILFADMSQYLMIDKGGVEAASSMHVRFIYDEMTYRFVARVDGQPAWDAALTPFTGSNTQSPFVALATRS